MTAATMKRYLLILFFLIFGFSISAHALSVKQLTPQQLVGQASCIVSGVVTDVTADRDVYESGFMVKYFTLKVLDRLKGDCGADGTFVFKQVVGVKGLPEYTLGKTYLLFLPEAHPETGLCAPIGIWQGRYELVDLGGGRLVVPAGKKLLNALAASSKTSALSLSLSQSAAAGSGADYGSFKKAILQIVGEAK